MSLRAKFHVIIHKVTPAELVSLPPEFSVGCFVVSVYFGVKWLFGEGWPSVGWAASWFMSSSMFSFWSPVSMVVP